MSTRSDLLVTWNKLLLIPGNDAIQRSTPRQERQWLKPTLADIAAAAAAAARASHRIVSPSTDEPGNNVWPFATIVGLRFPKVQQRDDVVRRSPSNLDWESHYAQNGGIAAAEG